MTDDMIRAPRFDFGAAVTQVFNLPSGNGYLFRVLGFGTLILSLSFVLLGYPIVKAYISMFQGMAAMDTTSGLSEAEEIQMALETMQPIFAAMGWFSLLYLVQIGVYVSVETALYRNIIRGEDKGLFPLRFGGDEFKVLITRIVVAVILYAVLVACYFVIIILGAMAFGLGSSTGSTAALGIIGVLAFVLFLGLVGVMIYASIRLAPSAAFAVRDIDYTPVGSWGTMKTYFWPTFGAVLVVGIIGYIVISIFSFLALGTLLFASGIFSKLIVLDETSSDTPDFTPLLDTLASPGFIIPAAIVTLMTIFLGLLYTGAIWSIWGYVAKLTARSDSPV